MKITAAMSGVKIRHKNKTQTALLLNCGPQTLHAILTEITTQTTPPHNITTLLAAVRAKGYNINRGALTIDLACLEKLGVITCRSSWRETIIKPNYKKTLSVKLDDEERTVVQLD